MSEEPWRPPLPAALPTEREGRELCARCGNRKSLHECWPHKLWCISRMGELAPAGTFVPSGRFEGEG